MSPASAVLCWDRFFEIQSRREQSIGSNLHHFGVRGVSFVESLEKGITKAVNCDNL